MTSPIERVADAKRALEAAQARYSQAAKEALEFAQENRVTQWKPDGYTVSVCQRRELDDVAFLEWARKNRPDQVRTVDEVYPSFKKIYVAGLTWTVDGEVVDYNGEPVPFAGRTEYLSVRPRA